MKNIILILIAGFLIVSCSHSQDNKHEWTTAEYFYRTGSVPPPYHYEYDVIINSNGESSVVLRLGYSNEPSGTYSFQLSEEDITALTKCMGKSGLFDNTINSLPENEIPIGGSTNKIRVTYVNPDPNLDQPPRVYDVPYFPEEQYQAGLNKLYEKIRSLVPQSIWSDINNKTREHSETKDN